MNKLPGLFFLLIFASCTTIHFRSNNSVPVTFEGNPKHQREVSIVGQKNFYFWGVDPEHHEVYIDEEVRGAGYESISKLIIYEHKNPQDILISFLTFGLYMPSRNGNSQFFSSATWDYLVWYWHLKMTTWCPNQLIGVNTANTLFTFITDKLWSVFAYIGLFLDLLERC